MINLGKFDLALRALEVAVKRDWVPECVFFFGDEEKARSSTPPWVIWTIVQGEPLTESREIRETSRVPYIDDAVRIVARCAGVIPQGQQRQDMRRLQMEASIQVFLAVSLVVAYQHQGYYSDQGWAPAPLSGSGDAIYAIDYTFDLRARRLTPDLIQVQPLTQEPTIEFEVV